MSIRTALAFTIACVLSNAAGADISFEDTSASTGVNTTRFESWGASWGDFNGDGRPDVFTNNHRSPASLWQNNGDGTFTDVSFAVDVDEGWTLNAPVHQDNHGAAWGDADNDGDPDLFMSGNQEWYYRNDSGNLRLVSTSVGFSLELNREGSSAAWLDYNNDNFLDLKISHSNHRGVWRQNTNGTFSRINNGVMRCNTGNQSYIQIGNINNQNLMDVVCIDAEMPLLGRIHEMQTNSDFLQISGYPIEKPVRDSAIADFNGDGLVDIFGVKSTMRPSDAFAETANRIESQLSVTSVGEKGVFLRTTGVIDVFVDWNRGGKNEVYVGAAGLNLTQHGLEYRPTFQLDPANPAYHGTRPRADGDDKVLVIGYHPSTQLWEFAVRANGIWSYAHIAVDSSSAITIDSVVGQEGGDLPLMPSYLINTGTGLTEAAAVNGFQEEQCVSVAAGDFDNDMDVDLYLACRGGAHNTPNVLYENLGDGTFSRDASAGGANGPVGVARGANEDGAGTSDSAVVADYDLDGYLDLFVTNGLNMRPTYYGGPNSMFRNTGSGNNWLQFDLEGVTSNRSGIGAKLTITTPDGTAQIREQNGGYHRWSQDLARIHVGLAQNATADVRVEWPSGTVDTFDDVDANGIYVLNEGGAIEPKQLKTLKPYKCNIPPINTSVDSDLFIWKRCTSPAKIWELRATSDIDNTVYEGGIFITSGSVSNAQGINLENDDQLTHATDITFDFQTASTGFDGFTFEMPDPSVEACLDFRSSKRVNILVGEQRRPYRGPFDLNTLEPCSALPNTAGPVLAAISDQSTERNDSDSLQLDATDADGDWPYFSATGLPPGMTIDEFSGLISGASATDGDYNVTITADDGRGMSDTETFTWSITAPRVPPPPVPGPRNGNGGGTAWWLNLLLMLALAYRLQNRRQARVRAPGR